MSMYETLRTVILGRTLPVSELQRRVDVFYAEAKITEAEKAELGQMIFDNQTPEAEKAEMEQRFAGLVRRMDALEKRVAAIEDGNVPVAPSDYPDWVAWDGVSGDYIPGAVVRHNGVLWENVLSMQNVWEPGVVDERYWKVVS